MKPTNSSLMRIFLLPFLLFMTSVRDGEAQGRGPSDVVQKLYGEVVRHRPLGVPSGAAKTAMWPLLSSRLIRAFDTRNACDLDWDRKYSRVYPPIKAPGFYENGLFSGADEAGEINGATAGAAERQDDASYLVPVSVWSYFDGGLRSLRTRKVYRWDVVARVIRQRDKFVVDDILLPETDYLSEKRVWMSKMLTAGCNGTHTSHE